MAKEKAKKKTKKDDIEENIKEDVKETFKAEVTNPDPEETPDAKGVDPNPIETPCDCEDSCDCNPEDCQPNKEDSAPTEEDASEECGCCDFMDAIASTSDLATSKKMLTLARVESIREERAITIFIDPPVVSNGLNGYLTAAEMRTITDRIIPPTATHVKINQRFSNRIEIRYTVSADHPFGTLKKAKKKYKQVKKRMNDAYGRVVRNIAENVQFRESEAEDTKD